MSVRSVLIGLQASRTDGVGVTSDEFLKPFRIQPDEVEATRADGGPWSTGMIYFGVIRLSAFAHVDTTTDAGAPSLAFFARIAELFEVVAVFLNKRQPKITHTMRAAGLSLQLFIDVWMDQDQFDIEFPPALLAACGRHSLGMYLITNDIAAADIAAANS